MGEPFWEETYKNDDILTFGPNPNVSLVEIEKFLNHSDNIVDVGCGDRALGNQSLCHMPRVLWNRPIIKND